MPYLLFTDETNQRPGQRARFFIYGGVFFPVDQLATLHKLVEEARRRHGFRSGDDLKFDTHSRPPHVSPDEHTAVKREVLTGCRDLGARFVAYLVLHEIARRRSVEELVSWGANTVLATFNRFLQEENDTGICILDRLPFDKGFQYLKEKFEVGVTFQRGRARRLDRIQMFAASCSGATHAISAIDIVLGAFRYCVNERERQEVPRAMLPVVVSMMWHRQIGETNYFRERGLLLRPKDVVVREHQQEYQSLVDHLRRLLGP